MNAEIEKSNHIWEIMRIPYWERTDQQEREITKWLQENPLNVPNQPEGVPE